MFKLNTLRGKLLFSFVLISMGYIALAYAVKSGLVAAAWEMRILSSVPLILFFIIAAWTKSHLTRPMQTLRKGLEKISLGNLAHRIHIEPRSEFAFLGTQFNVMAGKIESMMAEIEVTHKDLEKQVVLRTAELKESNRKLQIALQELRGTQKHIIQTEKQKSLTAIVSGFAHEINNPLTGILGYVDLLTMREDITPYAKEKLASIQKQAMRIKTIIDQLNQLNPDMEQVKMEINLANLLEKLVKVVSSRPGNSDFSIEKVNFDQDIVILGNHFALWQVFEGIVENAIEAFKENGIARGRIVIKLMRSIDGRNAIVEISDNGGGFKNLEKAFDPFYTTKSRTQKKGIGLTIAYNIIQEHAGNIVVSNNDMHGATVAVYLKLNDKKLDKPNQLEER
jgi:C4-dicarboxylate-specific signal transduction histidine kinase